MVHIQSKLIGKEANLDTEIDLETDLTWFQMFCLLYRNMWLLKIQFNHAKWYTSFIFPHDLHTKERGCHFQLQLSHY